MIQPGRRLKQSIALLSVAMSCLFSSAMADDASVLESAKRAAINTFERALPRLGDVVVGVPVATYRDALTLEHFNSAYWGGSVSVRSDIADGATGSCNRYAAFVRMPPQQGTIGLVLCPQFFSPGADNLRELTILHEMVHVVAGRDECQAMAFAARIEQAAKGHYTPVERYWQASGCASSPYSLPR